MSGSRDLRYGPGDRLSGAAGSEGGEALRVLMANEPRAYRESIAEVIRALRPGVEVETVEPESLEDSITRLSPGIVVCNRATSVVRESVPVWVELYPDYAPFSVVSIQGVRSKLDEIQLPDILSIVDRTVGV